MTVDYTRPPQQPGQLQPSWWTRNWKWVVPVGCLGIVALGLIFVAAIIGVVFGAMKSSDVYRQALQRARNSPEVQSALGTPIEPGWFMSGNINVKNTTGDADITFPISGPKGKANVHAVATKESGRWNYSTLVVQVEGGSTIDLLGGS
jgi:hypothetical protein